MVEGGETDVWMAGGMTSGGLGTDVWRAGGLMSGGQED